MYRNAWPYLTGAVFGCAVMAAAIVPGWAEPAKRASAAVAVEPSPSGHVLSAGKRPKAAQRGATRNARAKDEPWSIKDALPNKSRAVSAPDEADQKDKPAFGKIPLQSGTLSLETDPKINPLVYPDGQHAPGVDSTPHMPPSYLGFSFSVPTR
jgi:hypothetical protein